MKVGLVLEGGGMRGLFSCGVLDVMMQNNLHFDTIVGVSAGALLCAVNFLSKQEGRAVRYNKRFNKDPKYIGMRPLLKEGNLINTQYAYHEVPHNLDVFDNDTFKQNEANSHFYAVVTDVDSGEAEYMRVSDVFEQMDVLRASGSLPFVSKFVQLGEKRYLDGGIADSIPVEWMLAQGVDKMVVILTQHMGYVKKRIPALLPKVYYCRHKNLARRLVNRHVDYNNALKRTAQLESEGKAYVVRPPRPIKVHRVEKDEDTLQGVYDMGVEHGKKIVEDIKKFLQVQD